MIPYILAETLGYQGRERLRSVKYDGWRKWNAFVLDLSFIGWNLLSTITFGIVGVLYVNPYVNTTWAEFYKSHEGKRIGNRKCNKRRTDRA